MEENMKKKRMNWKSGWRIAVFPTVLALFLFASLTADAAGTEGSSPIGNAEKKTMAVADKGTIPADLPAYSGAAFVQINGNVPYFTDTELVTTSFETYSELDKLGRCGVAYANVGRDLMPTEKTESAEQINPSGWHIVKYPDLISDQYLYKRCDLIAYSLTGENSNEKNLITGTGYMDVEGMRPFEDQVADYVKKTGNHVLYRVTPVFTGENLLADGVLMEAESVEDAGKGIRFNVYVYNVQPGIFLDYATGDSAPGTVETAVAQSASGDASSVAGSSLATAEPAQTATTYILNTNTHKFHYPACSSVNQMKDRNKQEYFGNRADVIGMGYDPCKRCNP